MKLTIEIPDDLMTDLDTAIQKFNVRMQAELDERRGTEANLLPGTATDFLLREVTGCLRNFILSEHHRDLEVQTEALVKAEADRISKALKPLQA